MRELRIAYKYTYVRTLYIRNDRATTTYVNNSTAYVSSVYMTIKARRTMATLWATLHRWNLKILQVMSRGFLSMIHMRWSLSNRITIDESDELASVVHNAIHKSGIWWMVSRRREESGLKREMILDVKRRRTKWRSHKRKETRRSQKDDKVKVLSLQKRETPAVWRRGILVRGA